VDLDFYQEARREFTLEEWVDVLLMAVDYNPLGFLSLRQKMALVSRLLPFVEKRVNIVELAPKGTGKSYLFSQISKYGWLVSGGSVSRARLFYDLARRTVGLVTHYDYVALDEIQSISFPDEEEVRGALKGYLESGEYRVGDYRGVGEAGIVLLGNIGHESMSENRNMFKELPSAFRESALVDRFHGFVRGWDIPRMKESMKAEGWGLNVEYFSEIMHALRADIRYRGTVDELLSVPKGADTRDTEAIKRIATGFLKLLFPNAVSPGEIPADEFKAFCLDAAKSMRGAIRKQLHAMDPEYGDTLPDIALAVN
jgi:ATP-dependent Lon protease